MPRPFWRRSALILWLLVVLWIALIFWFSSQPSTVSSAQSDQVIAILDWGGLPPLSEFIVRKSAHILLFLGLGVLSYLALRRSGVARPPHAAVLALAFCALNAALDEFHQIFVPGRGALFTDVLIDTTAALVAATLCALLDARRLRHKTP